MRRPFETLLLPALLVVGCGAPAASGPATVTETETAPPNEEGLHAIRLSRPAAVGDRFVERSVHTRRQQQRVTVDGEVVEEETTEQVLELAMSTQVMEVNQRGAAMVTVHTIEQAVLRDANGASQVLLPGAVLRVRRVVRNGSDEEGSIELVDGTLSEEALDVLQMAFSTTVSPTGDDAIFGSEAPRRVGESWPINAARAVQDLNKLPVFTLEEGQVVGQTELLGLEDVSGVPCLLVRGQMHAEGFQLNNLPEGSEVQVSRMNAVMTGALPTDMSSDRLAETTEMQMHMRVLLPAQGDRRALMEMVVERASRREFER